MGHGCTTLPGGRLDTRSAQSLKACSFPLIEDLKTARHNSTSDMAKAGISLELGLAYQYLAGDETAARHAFTAALFEHTTRKTALEALARLHASFQNWEELVNVNHILATESDSDAQWVSSMLNIAHLLDKKLGRPHDALDFYNEVIEFHPENSEALLRAAAIMENNGDDRSAHYKKLYRLSSTPAAAPATSH